MKSRPERKKTCLSGTVQYAPHSKTGFHDLDRNPERDVCMGIYFEV